MRRVRDHDPPPPPTSTAARDGSGGSEVTAVPPTSTVTRDGSGGSGRVAEYAAWCGKIIEEEVEADDPETWGEAAQLLAKRLDVWEDMTPPEELKDLHNTRLAGGKAILDFSRSQDANEPYDGNVFAQESETTAEAFALASDYIAAVNALDDETAAQLADAGCIGS